MPVIDCASSRSVPVGLENGKDVSWQPKQVQDLVCCVGPESEKHAFTRLILCDAFIVRRPAGVIPVKVGFELDHVAQRAVLDQFLDCEKVTIESTICEAISKQSAQSASILGRSYYGTP